MKKIKIKSPAKLNLFLQVLNKRNDGYHNIKSIMQKIELFDYLTIIVEKNSKLSVNIRTSGFQVPSDENNLCYKAIKILAEEINKKNNISRDKLQNSKITIKLRKNIPVSAGIGGGSSNAAAVLTSLNKLLNLGLNENELIRIASLVGSDVPFFILEAPTCYVENKGDRIKILPGVSYNTYAILVKPDFHISTKCVYEELDEIRKYKKNKQRLTKKTDSIKITCQFIKEGDMQKTGKNLYNDLESVVTTKHKEIYTIKKMLLKLGAIGSIMSGSGPTVFGLIENEEKAKKMYNLIKNSREAKINKWLVKKVRLLSNAPKNFMDRGGNLKWKLQM